MKMTTKIVGHVGRHLAGLDRSPPEARADGALLDDGELGRQRAGAQQDREVVDLLRP